MTRNGRTRLAAPPVAHHAGPRRFSIRLERTALTAFSRGRLVRQTARPGNGCAQFFSAAGELPHAACRVGTPDRPPLHRRQKNRSSPSSADASALCFAPGAGPARLPPFVATKAAMGAANPAKESTYDD
jgi:hypothetical protein